MPITEVFTHSDPTLSFRGGVGVHETSSNNWVITTTDTGYKVFDVNHDGTDYTVNEVGSYDFNTTQDGITLGGGEHCL